MYSSKYEFIDCYLCDKLNKYNTKLIDDYAELNLYDKHFYEETIDIKYVDGCFCYLDGIYDCECENDVHYYYDDFMKNKISMFPKNNFFQECYENIFLKRFFDNKIFYYLPNGCKRISIRYIDKTIINTYDISRTIIYYFINNSIALIQDQIDGWFGNVFIHYHTHDSVKIKDYLKMLNEYNVHINDVSIINYSDN